MAGFFESPWGRLFFVVIPRLPVSRQTRAGLMKKATQRRLQKAALGVVSFAAILGLHIPRQTRAGHLKKAAHGRLLLVALGSSVIDAGILKLALSKTT